MSVYLIMLYGASYSTWKSDLICPNCDKPAEELIDLPAWGTKACPKCAVDFAAAEEAEALPSCAVSAICQASSVGQMPELLRAHIAECAICGSTRKTVQSDREVLGTQDSACCDQKEIA